MKIKDPSLEEMEEFLRGDALEMEATEAEITEAIYWFAEHHNGGMNSSLYKAKCRCTFHPARCASGLTGANQEALYNLLSIEYAGMDLQGTKTWNNQARAAYAIQAVKAYAKAKGERTDESDVQDLISDLLHLKAMIYEDPSEDGEAKASEVMQSAFGNFIGENESIDRMEWTEMLDVQVEHQKDLVQWLKDAGRTDQVEWIKPEVTK